MVRIEGLDIVSSTFVICLCIYRFEKVVYDLRDNEIQEKGVRVKRPINDATVKLMYVYLGWPGSFCMFHWVQTR